MAPTIALYHHLPPGGAERAMFELVRETADRYNYILFRVELGHRDPYASVDRPPIEDFVDVRSFPARAGGASRLARWSITVPSIRRAERRIANAINADPTIDAVVTHHQRFLQVPGIHRCVKVPSLYFVQEPRRRSFEYDLRYLPDDASLAARLAATAVAPLEMWAARHDRRETRAASAILCNSDHSREYIWRAYGRDATPIRLGVDGARFALRAAGRERVNEVVAVGSLDVTKGHDLAVAAVGQIAADRRPALRIIHNREDDTTRQQLVDLADSLGVELRFERDVDEATLVERYQSARAVLLTARVEPLGLTSLESMACGTPVVAVREGGYRETVIEGTNGLLTDRSPEVLGLAIARVLDGEFDGRDAEIRASAIDRFSWNQAGEAYAEVLDSLLN